MARLYRPHIPIEVKLRVVMRQLGYSQGVVNEAVRSGKKDRALGDVTSLMLARFAEQKHCAKGELRLDHDPPLGARPRHRRGLNPKTFYTPDANDPDHLFYRPHGPEHDGSHLIKTNVRGEHGQHPDRVLIKKQRRIERGPKPKRGPKIKGRGFPKPSARENAAAAAFFRGVEKIADPTKILIGPMPSAKRPWAKRPFPKRSKS